MAILSFSKGSSTLNVINNILKFENQRGVSIGRISSGLRVRKAADSVSESAIGSKIRNEVESLKSILTSTASAKSVLEIAEGGLGQISNIITRMTSLALLATNSTNTDDDRAKIDSEFQELKEEITRTAKATNFNTRKILNGGGGSEYIGKSLTGFKKVTFKDDADTDTAYTVKQSNAGVITIASNKDAKDTQEITYNNTVSAGETVDLDFDKLGIVVTLDSSYTKGTEIKVSDKTTTNSAGTITNISGGSGITDNSDIELSFIGNSTAYISATIDNIVYQSDKYDFLNEMPLTKLDTITLKAQDGTNSSITFEPNETFRKLTSTAASTAPTSSDLLVNLGNTISPGKKSTLKFQVGTEFSDSDFLKIQIDNASASSLGLSDGVNLKDSDNIGKVTEMLKKANSTIQNIRTKVGVVDNRLDVAIQNIQTTITNSEAAVSAIFNLDIPSEIAELSSLEMKQTAAIEALARDIRAKQSLMKLF